MWTAASAKYNSSSQGHEFLKKHRMTANQLLCLSRSGPDNVTLITMALISHDGDITCAK